MRSRNCAKGATRAAAARRAGNLVDAAQQDAIAVQLQQLALEIAGKDVEKNRAGHYPTLDAVVGAATPRRRRCCRSPAVAP